MQTLYSDASGHDGNGELFIIAAGWVSSVKDWLDFDAKWRAYVSSQCQTDCFHMTDFKANEGNFTDWKDREHEKEAFLHGLADLIDGHTYQSFAASLTLQDYRDAKLLYPFEALLGNGYAFAARGLATLAQFWAIDEKMSTPRFVFERGDAGQKEVFQTLLRDGYDTPNFEPKCSAAGLQAADMLAWYLRRDLLTRHADPSLSLLDPVFLRFHGRKKTYWRSYGERSLNQMIEYLKHDPEDFEAIKDFRRRQQQEKRDVARPGGLQ